MAWGGEADTFRGSIRIADEPSAEDFATIFRALDETTASVAGPSSLSMLVVLLQDPSGAVVGGLWARTVYSWLVIEMMFVPEPLRGRGVGSRLVATAEAAAVQRGCIRAQVSSFEFQASAFYQRLGYTVFAVQQDMPPGHRTHFLEKHLVQ